MPHSLLGAPTTTSTLQGGLTPDQWSCLVFAAMTSSLLSSKRLCQSEVMLGQLGLNGWKPASGQPPSGPGSPPPTVHTSAEKV